MIDIDNRPRSLGLAGLAIVAIPALLLALIALLPTPETRASNDEVAPSTDGATAGDSVPEGSFAIVGAQVFDGEKALDSADIWVEDGRIRAVGTDLDLPADLPRVDGVGHTVLPGLIDAHVHTWGSARADAVRAGVTTLLDQFSSPAILEAARADRAEGGADDRADLFGAGTLATVNGGHGTQFGLPVPQVEGPETAEAWVAARVEEGSDWIKIVVEPGWHGSGLPTLDMETVGALVEAAHAQERKAVVHVSTLDDALGVAKLGADGLVHVWRDRQPTAEEVEVFVDAGLFIIPTLVVMEGMVDPAPSLAMVEGPLGRGLGEFQTASLERRFPPASRVDWQVPTESVKALAAAGVPILVGSDAPNPSTAMGFSVHRELRLLVDQGLSPGAALAAATSVPADLFAIPERGRIAEGRLADLLMVQGDPLADIDATQEIARVWKRGRSIEIEAETTAAETETETETETAASAPKETVLADFEDGLRSRFGAGWTQTTDQRMGGQSETTLEVVDGALVISGELKRGSMFPWAGGLVFPGEEPMSAVDFSDRTTLRFRTRGDGRTYSVMLFCGEMQGIPPTLTFETTAAGGAESSEDWSVVELPLSGFAGADIGQLRGIAFTATGQLGTFRFELDEIELR